jgi:hypothetical protein
MGASSCCWRHDGCWEKRAVGPIAVTATDFSHQRCYLSAFGCCGEKITKEHFISRNILEKIAKEGLKFENAGHFFGGRETVEIGIDGFSAKVLCDIHNNSLSPLDSAVGLAFGKFETLANELMDTAIRGARHKSLHIASGLDIERWLIKVYCGLAAAGKIRTVGGRVIDQSEIPTCLLETLIRSTELPAPLGLYMHAYPGQERRASTFSFATIQLTDGSDSVGGLLLALGLMNFVLVTSDQFGRTFTETTWYRHQQLSYNINSNGSRIGVLFTY